MVSAYQGPVTGFGLGITSDQLKEVSKKRMGQKYADEEAAKSIFCGIENPEFKRDLTEDPSVQLFEYGKNKQGYWTYDHTVTQMEDVRDCVVVMYPEWEISFIFDHSSGHTKGRQNGLNVNNMNVNWGGNQNNLRQDVGRVEKITPGCLGKYNHQFENTDTQYFNFQEEDDGPFYISKENNLRTKRDTYKTQKVKHDRKILKKALSDRGIFFEEKAGVVILRGLCTNADPPIEIKETKEVLVPGWCGKPKGMRQIL